jgi:hypothetical protein
MQVIKYQESYSSQMIKEMMPKFFIIMGFNNSDFCFRIYIAI